MDDMKIPTDLELMHILVKELPDLIVEDKFSSGWRFYWKPPHPTFAASHVTMREWDWIAREVEKKLTNDEWDIYCELLGGSLVDCASASWQLRSSSYFVVKGRPA